MLYSHLAGILQSLDMKKEACVAFCHSLRYTQIERYDAKIEKSDPDICDILLFSDEYFSGLMSRSLIANEQVTMIIHKITRLYITSLEKDQNSTAFKMTEEEMRYFQTSTVGVKLLHGSDWDYEAKLAFVIKEILGTSYKNLVLLNELILSLGKTAASMIKNVNLVLEDVESSIDLVIRELETLPAENICSIYIMIATLMTHLMSEGLQNKRDETVLCYVQKALSVLESCLNTDFIESERRCALLTYNASLMILEARLKYIQNPPELLLVNKYKEALENCSSTVEIICMTENLQYKQKLFRKLGNAIMWSIGKIYLQYFVDNESEPDFDKLTLLLKLSTFFEIGYSGLEAVVVPMLIESEQDEKAQSIMQLVIAKNDVYPTRDISHKLKTISSYVCNLIDHENKFSYDERVTAILSMSFEIMALKHTTFELQTDLEKSFELVDEKYSNFSLTNISPSDDYYTCGSVLVICWWLSCCHAALGKGYNQMGDLQRALSSLHHCIKVCKDALKIISQFKPNVPSVHKLKEEKFAIMFICLSSFKSMYLKKICNCYELTARINCHIGDHKKAKAYVIASCETLGVILKNSNISTDDTIEQMLNTVTPKLRTIRHLILKNTIIDVFSCINPANDDSTKIRSIFMEESLKSESVIGNLDWLRETVKTYILREFKITIIFKQFFHLNIKIFSLRLLLFSIIFSKGTVSVARRY